MQLRPCEGRPLLVEHEDTGLIRLEGQIDRRGRLEKLRLAGDWVPQFDPGRGNPKRGLRVGPFILGVGQEKDIGEWEPAMHETNLGNRRGESPGWLHESVV